MDVNKGKAPLILFVYLKFFGEKSLLNIFYGKIQQKITLKNYIYASKQTVMQRP